MSVSNVAVRFVDYDRPMIIVRIALLAMALVVAGCSAGAASQPPSQGPGATGAANPGSIALPASVVDPVVADIARIAAVPAGQVTIVSAERVTFPDGSLGCPEPGMAYTQMVVEGFKIVATAAGATYDYRGTGAGEFRRCMNASR